MVNQELVDYVKEGKNRGFAVSRLKQELLKGGFDAKSIDEAISVAEGKTTPSSEKVAPAKPEVGGKAKQPVKQMGKVIPSKEKAKPEMKPKEEDRKMTDPLAKTVSGTGGKGGIQWMKITGVIGFILAILYLSVIVLSLLDMTGVSLVPEMDALSGGSIEESQENATALMYTFLTVLGILYLMLVLHFTGFAKLGSKGGSKLLKISAWIVVVSLILNVLAIVGLYFYYDYAFASIGSQLSGIGSGEEIDVAGIISTLKIGLYVVSGLLVIGVVGMLLMSVGLIMVGKNVKIAMPAGFTYILTTLYYATLATLILLTMFSFFGLIEGLVAGEIDILGSTPPQVESMTNLMEIFSMITGMFAFLLAFHYFSRKNHS
jgi:hypothetical protein